MATGIGEAIGLQNTTRQQGDPLQWLRLAGAEKRQEKAQKKAAEKELVSSLDFKVPYDKGLLPDWGNAIAQEKANLLNNYVRYSQEDPVTAQSRIYSDLQQTQAKVSALLVSNDAAKYYATLNKDDFNVDETLQQKLLTANPGGFKDTNTYITSTGLTPFVNVGEDGSFRFQQVKKVNPRTDAKFVFDKEVYDPKSFSPIPGMGGKGTINVNKSVSDESVMADANRLSQDPAYAQNFLYQNRDKPELFALSKNNPQEFQKQVAAFYAPDLMQARPTSQLSQKEIEPHHAPASTGDKKYNTSPQAATFVTMQRPKTDASGNVVYKEETTTEDVLDASGNITGEKKTVVKKTPEKEEFQVPIRYPQAVTTKAAITVQNNPRMFSAETNEPIKGTYAFDFRPSQIMYMPVRDNPNDMKSEGKWKPMVLGSVVKNVNGQEVSASAEEASGKVSTEKTYQVIVPYEGAVKDAIDAGTNTFEFQNKSKELSAAKQATSQSTKATTPKKAFSYTSTATGPDGQKIFLSGNKWVNEDGTPYKQ